MSTRRYLCVLSLLGLLSGCASVVPLGPVPAVGVPVARFSVTIDGLEADFPDRGGGLLPGLARVVQDAKDVTAALRTLADPESSAVALTLDTLYATFVEASQVHLGLTVLPAETLRGDVRYFARTPIGEARSVARRDAYPGVLEVDVEVDVPDAGQSSWSILGTGHARVSGHPELTMNVRMVGADGQTLWRDRVRVRSRDKVTLDERWLLGFRRSRTVEAPTATLPDLLRAAVQGLAEKERR